MLKKRLGRGLDLRFKFGANHRESWQLTAASVLTILLNVTTTRASLSAIECCPENTTWLNPSSNCSDGSRIRINCDENGFYGLEPSVNHFDEFVIDDRDGIRLEFTHDYASIPEHRFCVSGKNDSDRWALVCFDEPEYVPHWKQVLVGILSVISAIFLTLTLMVYIVLPELRDIQDKSMASVVGFLAVSYFILAIQQFRHHTESEDAICVPLAFAMYWTFLSAFFWMNLVSFNVWRSVWFKQFPILDRDLFLGFCGIAFVGPGLLLIATLASHHTEDYHLSPGFGNDGCWFGDKTAAWAFFYGPIAVLLMLNVVYLGLTCWRLWYEYRAYTGGGLKSLRFNCLLYGKLVLVMGISWLFEVASYAASSPTDNLLWLATDVLNCLQGLVIFVLLVIGRRRVKKLLARRKPCGLAFPKSWAAYEEDEETVPALPVDMELGNSL